MDTTQLFNPLLYGKLTQQEAKDNNATYERNASNDALKEYVKKKFDIPHDDFHFEEGDHDILLVVNNKNEVVQSYP